MALVNAERKFARRTAKWLMKSRLDRSEIAKRLSLFPNSFVELVNEEASKLRGIPPPTKSA